MSAIVRDYTQPPPPVPNEYLDALETVLKHETDPDLRRAARDRYLALTEGNPT